MCRRGSRSGTTGTSMCRPGSRATLDGASLCPDAGRLHRIGIGRTHARTHDPAQLLAHRTPPRTHTPNPAQPQTPRTLTWVRGVLDVSRHHIGAGEGNRTLMTSLEGWGSAIELRPRGGQAATV